MTLRKIFVWLKVLILMFAIVAYIDFLGFYEEEYTVNFPSSISRAVHRAVVFQDRDYASTPGFPNYRGGEAKAVPKSCNLSDGDYKENIMDRTCRIIKIYRHLDYCNFWWLNRKCITFEVDNLLYDDESIRNIINEALRNPCKFMPNPINFQHYSKLEIGISGIRREWYLLGCGNFKRDEIIYVKLLVVSPQGNLLKVVSMTTSR